MIPDTPVPRDRDCGLGAPFDHRLSLLEAYDRADRHRQSVAVDGNPDTTRSAEWLVAEVLGDIDNHRHHLANTLMMMFRDALRVCPDSLSNALSEVRAVAEIADAVATLEEREGVTT